MRLRGSRTIASQKHRNPHTVNMFLEIVSFIVILILASTQVIRYPSLRTLWMFWKLPAPMDFPILGRIDQLIYLQPRDVAEYFIKNYVQEYKHRMSAGWLLGEPIVLLHHLDDVKELLGSPIHTTKGHEYSVFKPLVKEGLVTSTGKKWQERRKMLTSTFHFKILEGNLENMWIYGGHLVRSLLDTKGEATSVQPLLNKCTLDIICKTAMNKNIDPDDQESVEYIAAAHKVTEGAMYRIFHYYLNRDWVWNLTSAGREEKRNLKIIRSFDQKVISQRREYFKTSKSSNGFSSDKKTQPFLDKLIEVDMNNPGTLSDDDIQEEVATFMFAGYDTTSVTMGFILWELGLNPDVQERAYHEIEEIFGGSDREVELEDLQKMQYLGMIIKESMRLYPAGPYISRGLTEDLVLRDSTVLAAGFNVAVSSYLIHRNPKFYPDPEKFDPERFTPAECAQRHPYAYIPFSAGPRNCLGQKFAMMEMKVLISTVLRYCKIEAISKREDVTLVPVCTLQSVDPIMLRVQPRRPFS